MTNNENIFFNVFKILYYNIKFKFKKILKNAGKRNLKPHFLIGPLVCAWV